MAQDETPIAEDPLGEVRADLREAYDHATAALELIQDLVDSPYSTEELEQAAFRQTEAIMWIKEHGHGSWIEG